MNPSKPKPIIRSKSEALECLKDARLSGVSYHYLAPSDGTDYAGGGKGVDYDLAAVELSLGDRGPVSITWAMAGDLEGLAVLKGRYVGIGTGIVDAALREAWRHHIGERITSMAASWQISGQDCPESLWSVRLSFAAGSTVIALGTAPDMDYMPDELVVVFDMSLARGFKPMHVSDSAWGAPL